MDPELLPNQPNTDPKEVELKKHYQQIAKDLLEGKITPEEFARELTQQQLQLEAKVDYDGMIGTFLNHRGFMTALKRELQNLRRFKIPAVLWAADMDKFKEFNDSQGHPAGDLLLQLFARVVEENTRSNDLKGRVGGDEFLILFIGTDLKNAQAIVERIHLAMTEMTKATFLNFLSQQTISSGLTQIKEDDTIDTARERADQALYQAKQNRGQTILN